MLLLQKHVSLHGLRSEDPLQGPVSQKILRLRSPNILMMILGVRTLVKGAPATQYSSLRLIGAYQRKLFPAMWYALSGARCF